MAQQILQAQIVLSGRMDASFGKMVSSIDGLGNKMLVMGSNINQISQPIINTGKEITTMYAGFDDSMKYIQALGGLTQDQLKTIEKAARQAGATTRYTATQAAEALSYGAEAGLKYTENISLLGTTLNMAAAGNMDLQTSMDQLLTILYSTGTPLDNASALVDQLAAAASSSKTDIQSMGEAIARMGGISRYAKGGTQELFTMLAMMAQRGQEGAEAGTYLRNVILSLVAPTKKASEVMAELGASEEELSELADELDLGQAAKQMDELGLKTYENGKLRPFMDILKDLDSLTENMTEEKRNDVMSKLFPKRTLSAASNLLGELDVSMERINAEVEDSLGLAEKMAETRESGIGGALRLLKNAGQELELSFGKTLTDKIMTVSETVRNVILTISQMPEAAKGVLVDVAAVLAGMGPAAILAGFGLKGIASLLAFIGSPVGAVMTGVLALGVLTLHMAQLSEERKYNAIKQRFGELEVDSDALAKRVNALDGGLGNALTNIEKYGEATKTTGEKYNTLVQTLSGDITDAVVFNRVLSDSEITTLQDLGGQMVSTVQEGIRSKQIQMQEFADLLFADDPEGKAEANLSLSGYFDGLIAESALIGADIRSKMTEALRDGKLNAEEWDAIKSSVERLSEIEAKIQNINNQAEVNALLEKGMRLGYGAYNESKDAFIKKQNEIRDRTNTLYDEYIGYTIAAEEELDKTGEGQYTDEELKAYIEELRKKRDAVLSDSLRGNSEAALRLVDNIFNGNFGDVQEYAKIYNDEILRIMRENPNMDITEARGLAAQSDKLPEVDKDQFLAFNAWMADTFSLINSLDLEGTRNSYLERGESVPEWITRWDEIYGLFMSTLGGADWRGGTYWDRMTGPVDSNQIYNTWLEEQLKQIEDAKPSSSLVRDTFGGLVTQSGELGAEAANAYNSSFLSNIGGGWTEGGVGKGLDGHGVYKGGGGAYTKALYGDGGRAVEASIFGEDGPEWAIPEAHTTNTAQLLDSAREASGFSWGEILARAGGLNGDPDAGAYIGKIIYSPTIIANDATGVEEKLIEDHRRFRDEMDNYFFEKSRREL